MQAMSSDTLRTSTVPSVLAALVLALVLVACSAPVLEGSQGPATETEAVTATTAGTAQKTQGAQPVSPGRLTGEDIHEDPERFAALAERMRQEFPALATTEGPAPVFHGLHLCSVLYADEANERDVQERYEHFLAGFSGEGYVSHETGRHWVDSSIGEFCPDLQPQLVR